MLQKHEFFYDALSDAIYAMDDRHGAGRKHFSRVMGYRGPNAHIMLSSALSMKNNEANLKRINIDQLTEALDEMDEDIRRDALEKIVNHWGLGICESRAERADPDVMRVVSVLLDLGSRHGGLEQAVRDAIEDGHIDKEEAKAIKRETFALRKLAKVIEVMMEGIDEREI